MPSKYSLEDRRRREMHWRLTEAWRRVPAMEKPGKSASPPPPRDTGLPGKARGETSLDSQQSQFLAEIEDHTEVAKERLARGQLDEPVVEVLPHADTPRMENGGNRSHDPSEDLWSRGEAEAKGRELVNIALSHKPKEAPRVRMDRDLQVGFLEVDGGHPVALTNRED